MPRVLGRGPTTVTGIATIRLESAHIAEMQRFYTQVIGFPLHDSRPGGFAVRAGATTLAFDAAPRSDSGPDSKPNYHFAFNIPSDQIESACDWLRARVAVLRADDGRQIVQFESWNASAIYFHDPAGNVVEFIARHDLAHRTDGDFRVDNVLGVSEIGIAIPESSWPPNK
jgi:catechol-2,3-dioxygenase